MHERRGMDEAAEMVLRSVADLPGTTAERWVEAMERQVMEIPPGFNWEALAMAGATRAHQGDLAWGRVAHRIYRRLAAEDAELRHAHELSAMMLAATLIARRGAVAGDSLLDPSNVVGWFQARRELTLAEVRERSAVYQDQPTEAREAWLREHRAEVRTLRLIKNRLNVLRILADAGHDLGPEAADWLALRPSLP